MTVATLFGREAFVFVGDLKISGLRLRFKAVKSLKVEPNTLDLHVFNLSASTRASLQTKGVTVVLVAGYTGTSEVIFAGDARTIDHVRLGPDWDTHIQCGDGEVAYSKSISSFSFGPGAKWTDVVEKLAGDLKVKSGDALEKVRRGDFGGAVDSFLQGIAVNGSTVREFDRVMQAAGFEWSIQNGKLQILRPNRVGDGTAVLLSPSSGLIGSPDHGAPEKDGSPSLLRVKSFLQPALSPGRAVRVESRSLTGLYRCEKVKHEGDTRGPEWYSSVEALPV